MRRYDYPPGTPMMTPLMMSQNPLFPPTPQITAMNPFQNKNNNKKQTFTKQWTQDHFKNINGPLVLQAGQHALTENIKIAFQKNTVPASVLFKIPENTQIVFDFQSFSLDTDFHVHENFSLFELEKNATLILSHGNVSTKRGKCISGSGNVALRDVVFTNYGDYAVWITDAREVLVKECMFINGNENQIGGAAQLFYDELSNLKEESQIEYQRQQNKFTLQMDQVKTSQLNHQLPVAIHCENVSKITINQNKFETHVMTLYTLLKHHSHPLQMISLKQCPAVDIFQCHFECKSALVEQPRTWPLECRVFDVVVIDCEDCSRVQLDKNIFSKVYAEMGHATCVHFNRCSMIKIKSTQIHHLNAGSESLNRNQVSRDPQAIGFFINESVFAQENTTVENIFSIAQPFTTCIQEYPAGRTTLLLQKV